jgi:DNA-binding MarR family transcriptional regulator
MIHSFTNAERVLLHLSRYPITGAAAPPEITQDGVAQAIGRTRAHAAIELKKLPEAGLVEKRPERVQGGRSKLLIALPTPAGIREADRIKAVASERGVVWTDIIMAPPNPKADLGKLMERCVRIQQELDNVRKSIISLQAQGASHE